MHFIHIHIPFAYYTTRLLTDLKVKTSYNTLYYQFVKLNSIPRSIRHAREVIFILSFIQINLNSLFNIFSLAAP